VTDKKYEVWRNKVARPYLEEKYGRQCSRCRAPAPVNEETGEELWHDVDHIIKRGGHPELKYDLDNVRFLCRRCHQLVT